MRKKLKTQNNYLINIKNIRIKLKKIMKNIIMTIIL